MEGMGTSLSHWVPKVEQAAKLSNREYIGGMT